MAEAYFRKKLKGYDTAEVDAFIVNLVKENEEKLNDMSEEIRQLKTKLSDSEAEQKRQREEFADEKRELEALINETKAKYDALCAQLGEKLHMADERAAAIIADAEAKKEAMISEARRIAESESVNMLEDTRLRCAALERATESFARRQKEITEGLERAKRSIAEGLDDIAGKIGK